MGLSTHHTQDALIACGGDQIDVRIKQGEINCKTGGNANGGFWRGDQLTWSNFGECTNEIFDLSEMEISFFLEASSGDYYCPNTFFIIFQIDGSSQNIIYESKDIDAILDDGDNKKEFKAFREGKLIKTRH